MDEEKPAKRLPIIRKVYTDEGHPGVVITDTGAVFEGFNIVEETIDPNPSPTYPPGTEWMYPGPEQLEE
jgi:hypothetical protein